MTNSFYAIYILIHIVFQPANLPQHETVAIQGIYKDGNECVERMDHFMKNREPMEKFGCVQVIHPTDDAKMEQQHRHEGSGGRQS